MEIIINIPDNLISIYITIVLLVFSLLYLTIQLKNGNETKKLNDWLLKNKEILKDKLDNNSYNSNNVNSNNTDNNNLNNKVFNDDNILLNNNNNTNNNNNNNNNSNNSNLNSNETNNNILIKNKNNNKLIPNITNNSNNIREVIELKNHNIDSNKLEGNNNIDNSNSLEAETANNNLVIKTPPTIALNNSNNNLFDKSSLKISLEQLHNNSSLVNTSSSDEEQVPASPVSSLFLSPLNFTTGKKRSKKNQFYYVSTYYSSCDLPNKIMDQDDYEDPLITEEIKQSELLNNGFKYKMENNLNNNKRKNNSNNDNSNQNQNNSTDNNNNSNTDNSINIGSNNKDNSNENQNNSSSTDNSINIGSSNEETSSSNENKANEIKSSTSDNDMESNDNVNLNKTINLLSSTNLNNKNNNSIISKSMNNYNNSSGDINHEGNTLLSPNETCIKKLKKKKCILPQVLQLKWRIKPKKVLIIKKYNDDTINELIPGLVSWLRDLGIQIIKESDDPCDDPLAEPLAQVEDPYSIDFIISMGGDGTILHTSSLFKTYIPPILSFSLGSLGFLTAFDYSHHREYIQSVIDGKCFVSYRLRLSCTVVNSETQTKQRYQVLNEVTIDRGTNPYLSNLECCCDGKLITIVQADGLIIATSTGSTAYSLSAGGSLVHPTIPAILITPICPHTLSFRPVILPSTSELVIRVPETSRCPVWASFDGKNRQELKRGDFVIIKTSRWAVPVVCKTDESNEWFEKLAQNLNWNVRMVQKSFNPPNPLSSSDSEGSSNGSSSTSLNKL